VWKELALRSCPSGQKQKRGICQKKALAENITLVWLELEFGERRSQLGTRIAGERIITPSAVSDDSVE
jgi:hypothetical protein